LASDSEQSIAFRGVFGRVLQPSLVVHVAVANEHFGYILTFEVKYLLRYAGDAGDVSWVGWSVPATY